MSRWVAVALALAACQPAFSRRSSVVDAPRILAVQSTPAEARPGAAVALSALAAEPQGAPSGPPVSWQFCVSAKPVADYDSVSPECFASGSASLQPLPGSADAFSTSSTLPPAGCALFGSEPLPAGPSDPPTRAVDPDGTGGYYQPVRVDWSGESPVAFGAVRLACALPDAPLEVALAFRDAYTLNQNPSTPVLTVGDGAGVTAGAPVQVTASWSAADAEPYVVYDLETSTLDPATERLRVSWFATDGLFESDVTPAGKGQTSASQTWTAPPTPGPVHFWAVLRDDRGGSSWQHLEITVR